MAGNVRNDQVEAFVASDYQGETIQVFVFFRGKFLGYQCFGQDRLTVGGAPGMDLPLPDCPEEEGHWDVYISRGALYAWFRSPAGGNGKEGHEDPRKVQPLDSFSLGEYRLQAKLLKGQGFDLPSTGKEEASAEPEQEPGAPEAESTETDLESAEPEQELTEPDEGLAEAEEESVVLADEQIVSEGPVAIQEEEEEEAEQAVSSSQGLDKAEGPEPEAAWKAVDEVEGISLDYARSIWKGGTNDERAEAAEVEPGEMEAEAPPAEPVEGPAWAETIDPQEEVLQTDDGPQALAEEDALETGEAESPRGIDLDCAKDFWGLSEKRDTVREREAAAGQEAAEPDAGFDEISEMEEIEEWIGFGLPEKEEAEDEPITPAEETPHAVMEPESPEDPEPLQEAVPPETVAEEQTTVETPPGPGPHGLVEGMSQEERTGFWDQMAREVSAIESEGRRLESSNAAVAMDEVEADEDEKEDWGLEDEYEEDDDEYPQDITYFSLIKEVFPNRAGPSKPIRGDHRALEVVRFRGNDLQDMAYLESGDDYSIRKGWSRSLWKRRGGVPPDFKLVRLKNGGLAELHLRDNAVKGRLYSENGSQDIWDLRGGKRGRFGLKGKASWLPLPADTWAVLRVNSGRYLVRYVPPRPKPVVQPLRPNISAGQFKLVSMSLLSHLLLILVIGLAVPDSTLEGYNRTDQFARIDPDALKALKPPPPPKELKKPKPVAKKKVSRPKPKPKVASKHRIPKSAKRSPARTKGKAGGGGGKKQVDVAQTGLLAALGSPDAGVIGAKGNSEILLAAVTNLDAVAVPSDTTTFNLAGVAGKLATSEIQVPTSDVIETVGAAQLIKNGDGTLGAMASKGSGEVRAVVHEPPKAKISIRGGMSREAVLKVVNAHLDEVRDCYERELLHNPGISGKILMEWLIQLDGTVRYAKVKFTNIGHSSDLHTCLQAQVVTWNFPRPKGGEEVLVTFPFLFESMGF